MNKVRKVCLIIVACVLVVAAGVMVYLTVQSGKSSNSASEVTTSKQLKKPNYVFVMFLITILTLILHLRLNHRVAKKVAVMIKVVNPINQVGLLPKKHIFTIL